MSVSIPEEAVPAVEALFGLSEENQQTLLASLAKALPRFRPDQLAESVAEESSLSQSETNSILSTILNLYYQFDRSDSDLDLFLERDLVEGLTATNSDGILPEGGAWERTRAFLSKAFKTDAIAVTAKAWGLALSHEKVMLGGRILTDIRPVFAKDPSDPPGAALIMNSLHIAYLENGTRHEVCFGMDTDDLELLHSVIDRALVKSRAISTLLDRCKIKQVDPT